MIGWECLFLHETYKVILSVYVDDFKMAGTKKGVAQAWKAIRGPDKLVLDEPQPFGAYLGCEQEVSTMKRSEAYERVQNIFPLVNGGYHAPEPSEPNQEVKKIRWHMKSFHSQCLERYQELRSKNGASTKLKEYAFPSIDDHQIPAEEFEEPGILNKDAAKVVMKCLYGARFVRFDLLWPIGDLARRISKWTKACDRRLDRLMGHLQTTLDHGLEGFVGDRIEDCSVLAYCDASFADELATSKSTSGFFICIVGPNTFMPINAFAKKQVTASHSTT